MGLTDYSRTETSKYFIQPFRHDEIFIYDGNGHMVMSWIKKLSKSFMDKVVKCMNEIDSEELEDRLHGTFYTENELGPGDERLFWKENHAAEPEPILIVRGWGRLTGTGGYHLKPSKAAEVQTALLEYVMGRCNRNVGIKPWNLDLVPGQIIRTGKESEAIVRATYETVATVEDIETGKLQNINHCQIYKFNSDLLIID